MRYIRVQEGAIHPSSTFGKLIWGKVGYVERSWNDGTVNWCKLPFVRGVCDRPDYGVKLRPTEITPIGLFAFLWGCIVQFLGK